jgi:HAD superfamily hydrolase (TIGR01509 family)
MLAGVIFDFDGIIVDTEPLHYRAFQEILNPLGLGYPWEDYLRCYIGYDDRDAFRTTFLAAGRTIGNGMLEKLIEAKGAAFQRIIAAGVKPYPGVPELLRSISGNLPLGLCSGALPSDIEPILKHLGIAGSFDVIVTAADVRASKPDPESYSLTVTRLISVYPARGVTAGNCLAIEDTPAGIASAKVAGLKVMAVTNSYPKEELTNADQVVTSLADVTLQTFYNLF